jgi:hypothetical protein
LINENKKPAFKTQTDIATPTMSLIDVSAEAPIIDCGDDPIDQGEILLQDVEESQVEEEEILLPEIVNLHHDLGCLLADAHGEYREFPPYTQPMPLSNTCRLHGSRVRRQLQQRREIMDAQDGCRDENQREGQG